MTPINKTDWDKLKEKKTSNIGFISRSNAFREPTEAERARAVMIETQSWQEGRGKKPYTVSAEYSVAKGAGINLKGDTQFDEARKNSFKLDAIDAYINTPMGIEFKKEEKITTGREPGWFEEFIVNWMPIIILSLFLIFITTFFRS